MGKRRPSVRQEPIVGVFAARLREIRRSRGLTQAEVAHRAGVTPAYVWRLESGGAAPGIDTVARLAGALGTTAADMLPQAATPDAGAVLRDEARRLFDRVVEDPEAVAFMVPLMARLAAGPTTGR